ncbi:hypothetical protein OG921_19210 [Aldersonia sp. NBC_00410]|uniref:hypothetical protein n=1 Tax=Aldersonia sp. NBC_00410 TaxID=2975954 RepID=UPI0022578BDD|nr:hypothetical protein [Aldersonia sp. NBC_00410]MCX5045298.1 hypothetical protein [Aldersonia sp. NBC_00410]
MPEPDELTALDLVDPALIAPRLRRVALIAAAIGIAVAVVVGLLVSWPIGLLVGAVIGGPTTISALLGLRRRIWMSGNVIHARRPLGVRRIDAAAAVVAEVQVRTGRVSQVALRVGDGDAVVTVPLALYTDTGGAELAVLALRRLADALAASDLAAAAAVSSVLVQQLRAEAREAGLEQRPLYAAARTVRDAGRGALTTLSDAEVAALLD